MGSNNHTYKTHRQNPQIAHRALCGLLLGAQYPARTTRSDEVSCGTCLLRQEKEKI